MKIRLVGLAMALFASSQLYAAGEWLTDYKAALAESKKSGKLVLMDFTGSTWCPPCIQMKKQVFDTQAFKGYALENLVLLELDFPQDMDPTPGNIRLAEKYGVTDETGLSVFPTLVLVNSDGKPLAIRRGEPFFSPPDFIDWAKAVKKGAQ